MKEKSVKQRAALGLIWKLMEKAGTQVIQFAISVVLARLITPEEYGIVGLLTIFMALSDVVIQQGLATALVQKSDADSIDFSSVYWANLVIACLLYLIMFLLAPLVASFYSEPSLIPIMRVLSLGVVIGSLGSVHYTIMVKRLEFRKSFFSGLSNSLVYGFVGIILAVNGAGVWALVIGNLSGKVASAIVYQITVKWRPEWKFSLGRVHKLFRFSSKLLITNSVNTVMNNIHAVVIGRYFPKADLGFYQRGQQIPQTLLVAIDGSLSEVLYPTFSLIKEDKAAVKSAVRRAVKISMFLILPILAGLFAVSESLTLVLFTERWIASVPFMQLSCIVCLFWPLAVREQAINAMGYSAATMKNSLVTKGLTLLLIFLCIPLGIYAILVSTIIASVVSLMISSYYTKKCYNYSFWELCKDIGPTFILAVFMGACVLSINGLPIVPILKLMLQVVIGVVIYVAGCLIIRVDSFTYVLNMVKKKEE